MKYVQKYPSTICRYGSNFGKKYGWVGVFFFIFGPHTPVTFLDKYLPRVKIPIYLESVWLKKILSESNKKVCISGKDPYLIFPFLVLVFTSLSAVISQRFLQLTELVHFLEGRGRGVCSILLRLRMFPSMLSIFRL